MVLPRCLDQNLCEQLKQRWILQGAPLVEHLRAGLGVTEIDALTSPLGLRIPIEARRWWGWHDGAGGGTDPLLGKLGPGREFLSLSQAVDEYEQRRRMAVDAAAHARRSGVSDMADRTGGGIQAGSP